MQLNSTRYIVLFAGMVCLVCSFFVSTSAVMLKSRQMTNVRLDKQEKVLEVSGIMEEGQTLSASQIDALFDERIEPRFVDVEKGTYADDTGIDPATYNQQQAAAKSGHTVDTNPASVKRVPEYALIYEVYKTSAKEELDLRVFPVEGLGLWGTLYGFLALDKDNETIRGLTFYHHKETPGLGGEVDNPRWKAKWPGRKAYNSDGEPVIRVIKGTAGTPEEAPSEVDGLSGATMTSNGVTHLLQFWLGEDGYGPFLAGLSNTGSDA